MLSNYLKLAVRNTWRNKAVSFINITGLALSIASCIVIAVYIWNAVHFDSFHKNIGSIYRITEKQDQGGKIFDVAVTPGPLAPALQKDFPEVANTVRFGSWSGLLKKGNVISQEKEMLFADHSMFSMFSFEWLKGNPNTALKSPDDILITESVAVKFFGKDWAKNDAVLGQVFRLNNQEDFKLAGVLKDLPENSSIRFGVLMPMERLFAMDKWSNKWQSNNFHTYIQLKAGTDPVAFAKKIEGRLTFYNDQTKDLLQLQPLSRQYLYSKFDFGTDWGKRGNASYIKIFMGVGILLLIIACVNFINLSTARSMKRSMEVGVRKVTGATRGQLITQFLVESVLIAAVAGLVALFIVTASQPLLQKLTGGSLPLTINGWVFAGCLLLFVLITGMVAGLYPALMLSAYAPVKVFKKTIGGKSGKRFRQGLVIVQFAISAALITCTAFMYLQLKYVQQKDLGFNKEEVVRISLKGNLFQKSAAFKEELNRVPTVRYAAPATMSLANVENSSYLEWEGMQTDDKFLITHANVDPDFIPSFGMQLISGSNFSLQKTNDTANYILNESAARRMGFSVNDVLGKTVTFWGAKGRVIGVVKDFHFKPLNTTIDPFIFRYQPEDRYFQMFVKVLPANIPATINQVEKIYKKFESEAPFEWSFLSESIDQLYRDDQQTANIIFVFACLTIFVGCMGLFGLTLFSTEQRVKEIGIRKVLGAAAYSILGLLSRDFLKLVLYASLLAVPVAYYATNRWLQNYAYRIDINWWVFAAVAIGLLSLAFITVGVLAIKSARANPAESLRTE